MLHDDLILVYKGSIFITFIHQRELFIFPIIRSLKCMCVLGKCVNHSLCALSEFYPIWPSTLQNFAPAKGDVIKKRGCRLEAINGCQKGRNRATSWAMWLIDHPDSIRPLDAASYTIDVFLWHAWHSEDRLWKRGLLSTVRSKLIFLPWSWRMWNTEEDTCKNLIDLNTQTRKNGRQTYVQCQIRREKDTQRRLENG